MMDDPQVVRPHPTRMEDLQWNPRLLAEWEAQEQKQRPKIQTKLPQMSTAQRRRNQAGQPRTDEGKYANKPPSKWKAFLPGQPAHSTVPLKKVSRPGRPTTRRLPATQTKKTRVLPPMESMMDRHPIVKVHWWITRGFRRWRRRKAKQFKALFSLRG